MTTLDIYEREYVDYSLRTMGESKYSWAASYIFDLTTYDAALDELFVKKIIDVCKSILNRTMFEYVHDENKYIEYILVCQILEKFNWINWGTSIRGAWFDYAGYPHIKPRPILELDTAIYDVKEIPFTEENLKMLIEFIESED